MRQTHFHGILVDVAFTDRDFPGTFPLFAVKQVGGWTLSGIVVPRDELDHAVGRIRENMRADKPFYSHLYDDELLIAVFKNQVFRASPHISTWDKIRQYGASLNIPGKQLDFWPNRFQDEIHYFSREEFTGS